MRCILKFLLPLPILLSGCLKPESDKRFELLSPEDSGVDFINKLEETESLNILTYEYFFNGAGVAVLDFDQDGLKDLFFTGNLVPSRLYHNSGNLKFEDVTAKAGINSNGKWVTGVSVADVNADGWPDIYLSCSGPYPQLARRANQLYINQKNGTFKEEAHAYGLADTGHSVQALFFDFDLDQDLDVYILTNTTDKTGPNIIRPKRVNGEMINTDRLYRNNGNNTFTDISKEAGITIEGYGLGVSASDFNNDGWPDLYVTNDYLANDLLYINNQDGTFSNRLTEYLKHTSYSAMGNDVADINNDTWVDIISVDMLPPDNHRQKMMFGSTSYDRDRSEKIYGYSAQYMRNMLQLNLGPDREGNFRFSEIGRLSGISATDWSWSPLLADFDNDGFKDLMITNGYARDITNRDFVNYRMQEWIQNNRTTGNDLYKALQQIDGVLLPVFAFQNDGKLKFNSANTDWGITESAYSSGAVYADLDNDGDLEFITSNINQPAFIYKNNSEKFSNSHFLNVRLKGPNGNINAFGASVYLYAKNTVQFLESAPVRGYQSSVDTDLHFGLGSTSVVDSIIIKWPGGKTSIDRNIKADQLIEYAYINSTQESSSKYPIATEPLFTSFSGINKNYFRHQETEYADFKVQPLLPHKYSENGPGITVGDFNQDGLEDFFVGGAYHQSGNIAWQQPNGSFVFRPIENSQKYEEDMAALAFDADGDQDLDSYIVSGGNEFEAGSTYYQDRLLKNDGSGNFKIDVQALPEAHNSGSCIAGADFDQDGDIDLFVGGRITPQQYPQAGISQLLINDDGKFTDQTNTLAPGLRNVGMVTGALWTDFDRDGLQDLILTGEWMDITLFHNNGKSFTKKNIPGTSGWWNSLTGTDVDEDGDMDYILGNLGLNSRFKASAQEPARLYLADFNGDGTADPLRAEYINGVEYPAHPRDDFFLQMVQFKKRFPSYESYSNITMEQLLAESKIKPEIFEAKTFASSVLINEGTAEWKLIPLPVEAQFGPINGIVTGDFNNDRHQDLIVTGNSYSTEVLTGRYDAQPGLILTGDGTGNFKPVERTLAGKLPDGNTRGLALLRNPKGNLVLVSAENNDTVKTLKHTLPTKRYEKIKEGEYAAEILLNNEKKLYFEFYSGSGYLSQSGRTLIIPDNATRIKILNYKGTYRELK